MLMKEKGLLVGRALKIAHVRKATSSTSGQPTQKPSPADGEPGKEVDTSLLEQSADTSAQAKPTHQNIIRMAPPLVISEEQIKTALSIIEEAMKELPNLKGKKEAEVLPPGEKNVHIGLEN